jgi:60 kDa SS-A/Ro ribonucleoprotein
MSKALKSVNTKVTDQKTQARADQKVNNAGGFVFTVTDKVRLERFLILGTDGGTYYANQKDHTAQAVAFLADLAAREPKMFIETVVEVSTTGRASKNSPAIFALAVAINSVPQDWKGHARVAVNKVCRTSTHLFEFAQYVENLGGWGRAKKGAVASWYSSKTPDELALQAVKYRQRDGWTHRDMLRLSHPALGPEMVPTVNFILGKDASEVEPRVIEGFRKVQEATNVKQVVQIVTEYRLPWEAVPTQFLNEPELWVAMVENRTIGHTAILRNITRMEKVGAFKDLKFAKKVADILSSPEELKKGRIHPIGILNAYRMYRQGSTTPSVVRGLNDGFYASFDLVEPSNARTMVALDVSGSMGWGEVAGLKGINPREASTLMAMVTLRTEPYVNVVGFTTGLSKINLSGHESFEQAVSRVSNMPFGGTDCSQPMVHAAKKGEEYDHFIVYTDNETWAGNIHPFQALKNYRQKTGINAKLTVVGMTATQFSIADPKDAGMLDVVGFDANAPKVIAEFARV